MITAQTVHSSDDEHDDTLTELIGTTKSYMSVVSNSTLQKAAEHLLEVAREKGLKSSFSQDKIVKALENCVQTESRRDYKCYTCGNVGIAHWDDERRFRICRECNYWYLLPIESNVDYKETITAAYISGFFEWLGIEAEKAKSILDFWKLRMKSMKLFNKADGGSVRFFSNYTVNSEDSKGYCECSEIFKAGSVVKKLPCGHLMHSACLKDLLMHSVLHAHDVKKGPRLP